jgi:dTDP-4-amino-4,6-dideoxygalactose transaminase
MAIFRAISRRSVNLPPYSLITLINCAYRGELQEGSALKDFPIEFAKWLGTDHVFGTSSGRTAFLLALNTLELEKGAEIIFPAFTFPVIPMVAKMAGYKPVFCDVDPETFNAGPEHIEPKITQKTGAVLATHLFGHPCPIREVAALARKRKIRLLEDCAHACGVRVNGQQVGTFGDIGLFSFAEGKNMPCFGGGVITTSDRNIAKRAGQILKEASLPKKGTIFKSAFDIWLKWLFTRPLIFGMTVYPMLRMKQMLGQALLDSVVGDDLLQRFMSSNPQVIRFNNLQAAIGLKQIKRIDAFNQGARENAEILTKGLKDVVGVKVPDSTEKSHIYVYYPLKVAPDKRDNLRHYLLRHRIDSKTTDMSDCRMLKTFGGISKENVSNDSPKAASTLEICVYPVFSKSEMDKITRTIRAWATHKIESDKEL